jgi:hypothetical protein
VVLSALAAEKQQLNAPLQFVEADIDGILLERRNGLKGAEVMLYFIHCYTTAMAEKSKVTTQLSIASAHSMNPQ